MEKKFWLVMVLAMVAVFITSCGDDDSGNNSNTAVVSLTATTADGPCGAGSVYSITELDPDSFQQLTTVDGTTDSLGRISGKELKTNTPYDVSVECYDFNEITGVLSESQVTLYSFLVTGPGETVDGGVPEVPGNITDISHFLSANIKNAYIDGSEHTHEAYEDIKGTAFASLISQMGFLVAPVDLGDCDVNELNIVSGTSSCNDTALAVELVVRNYAVKTADEQGQPQAAFLQNTLDGLKFAFEDGDLTGTLITNITASIPTLDVVTASANLSAYLSPLGGTAPNADTALDMDDDGLPNATDPDIDGDGFANADDEAPYDSSVGGGMLTDIAKGLGWELEPSGGYITWADAQIWCDDLVFAGYDDWRMPNYTELLSLVSGCDDPPCPTNDGPGVDGCYWKSALEGTCSDYWSVDNCLFYTFEAMTTLPFTTVNENCIDPTVPYYIRCVRTL